MGVVTFLVLFFAYIIKIFKNIFLELANLQITPFELFKIHFVDAVDNLKEMASNSLFVVDEFMKWMASTLGASFTKIVQRIFSVIINIFDKALTLLQKVASYPAELVKWIVTKSVLYILQWVFGILSLATLYVADMAYDFLSLVLTAIPRTIINGIFSVIPSWIPGVSQLKTAIKNLINGMFKINGKTKSKPPSSMKKDLDNFAKKKADEAVNAFKKLVGLD